nr:unnamed protein product [Haemonchus contortus]
MGKAALLVIVMCLAILGSTLAKPENITRQTRPSKEHLPSIASNNDWSKVRAAMERSNKASSLLESW